ncbi:MAG: hypothetical protein ACHRXM_10330 [Isosphaerales bacterium]
MPQPNDYAVIVGVQSYPGLDDPTSDSFHPLLGPVNDATAFYDWVTAPDGGDVPKANADLIARIYPSPPTIDDAQPIENQVYKALRKHYDRGMAAGQHAGRRLYVYMAGHGIEVASKEPALLMADAAPRQFNNHFLARGYADWFFKAGFFDEILLFMDCCRDNFPLTQPNPVRFDALTVGSALDRVRCLYGFGTIWSRRSIERKVDGVVRGVFSATLLAGLRGGAADHMGVVTAQSLQNFFNNHMKDFMDPADVQGSTVPQQPDFDPYPNNQQALEQFVIVKVDPLLFDVEVQLPAAPAKQRLLIQTDKFKTVGKFDAQPPVYKTKLPLGLYQIFLVGQEEPVPFDIAGTVTLSAGGHVTSQGVTHVDLSAPGPTLA